MFRKLFDDLVRPTFLSEVKLTFSLDRATSNLDLKRLKLTLKKSDIVLLFDDLPFIQQTLGTLATRNHRRGLSQGSDAWHWAHRDSVVSCDRRWASDRRFRMSILLR